MYVFFIYLFIYWYYPNAARTLAFTFRELVQITELYILERALCVCECVCVGGWVDESKEMALHRYNFLINFSLASVKIWLITNTLIKTFNRATKLSASLKDRSVPFSSFGSFFPIQEVHGKARSVVHI